MASTWDMMFFLALLPGMFLRCCGKASGLGSEGQYDDVLLPSPRAAVGRGRGWGVCQRAQLAASVPSRPPPPTPPHHARCAWEEGRRIHTAAAVDDDGLAGHEA